ncbi:MAG: sugar phosphate isomerase/epimerase [Bryobacterales bacterium]|nr:sugar phosphate isomerase/epimerase [Bryobacterales bacterium]
MMNRRHFLTAPALAPAAALLSQSQAAAQSRKFKISLAQWSIHKAIQSRMVSNLDFPRIAREQFGIEGLEFVNALWEAPTEGYVSRLKRNMRETGTQCVLIMCDNEGFMGAVDKAERLRAADNHRKWIDITAELGGHAIRTNMYPGQKQPATPAEIDTFLGHCAESFARLCEYAKTRNINVIIENHGGVSSNPDVVVALMKKAGLANLGTLPDFGNFPKEVDKYDAVQKLMPFAKGVSMKCFDFTPAADETTIDMARMMKIVAAAGYTGWVGIEYEGRRLTEFEGIQAAKRCLEKLL